MKTVARTDAAKFFCGFETFHTLLHGYLWLSDTSITFLGITATPTWSMVSVFINAAITIVLAVYAWGGKKVVGRGPRVAAG